MGRKGKSYYPVFMERISRAMVEKQAVHVENSHLHLLCTFNCRMSQDVPKERELTRSPPENIQAGAMQGMEQASCSQARWLMALPAWDLALLQRFPAPPESKCNGFS